MTTPPVSIVGFSSSDFVPGFVGEVKYAAGLASAASLPVTCLLVGTKRSVGTAVANQDVKDIFSIDDADLYFGAGSELARMCYQALRVQGVVLKAAPVAAAGGAVAATIIVTFANNATANGTYRFRLSGTALEFNIANGDTPTVIATSMVAAINAQARLAFTAANVAGVVTITCKDAGARGNSHTYAHDISLLPGTTTATVSGSSAMSGSRFRFTGGTGTESPATLLGVLQNLDFRFVGMAQNDQTNITGSGLWKDTLVQKAGPLVGLPSFAVTTDLGDTSPSALAIAINDPLWQLCWGRNLEAHPSEVTAYVTALRATTNAVDPNASFSGQAVLGIFPQVNSADIPNRASQVSSLNNGITPLTTTSDSTVRIVRAITTKSLSGGAPDYSTLDVGQAYVPQFVRLDLSLLWLQSFGPNNKRVQDDPDEDDKEPAQGVAFPKLWSETVTGRLKDFEQQLSTGAPPILVDVDENPVVSGFDPIAHRIMTLAPVKVMANNEQVGVSVRQVV